MDWINLMRNNLLISLFLCGLFSGQILAADCNDLNDVDKIRDFVNRAKIANPLLRPNLSSLFEIKTREGDERHKSLMHLLKKEGQQRLFFVQGDHAPACVIKQKTRETWCNRCETLSSTDCRVMKSDESVSRIRGTNIDLEDFDLLVDEHYQTLCEPVKGKDKFLKITLTQAGGKSPYDKIISYYDKQREVPITINLFSNQILKKVYRFFPKYMILLDGQWISAVARVRSVTGKEKNFSFETLVYVKKDGDDYQLYLRPEKDPILKGTPIDMLFRTE
jgi:hypothetical protein